MKQSTWRSPLLDLRHVTDGQVRDYVAGKFSVATPGSDRWRVLGATLELLPLHSFVGTRTYPRPDHPDLRKRLPLSYLVAAVLVSLRTTLENEMRAVDRLIAAFPTEPLLLQASAAEIAQCIAPAGMADSKSRRIVGAFEAIGKLEGGLDDLRTWPKERARSFLLALPGFGPKAADCVLTIGLGIPSMVVDVNVFRVATSLFDLSWPRPTNYADASQVFEVKSLLDRAVGDDAFLCQIVHTTLLLEGRRLRGAHDPSKCLISDFCLACVDSPILF